MTLPPDVVPALQVTGLEVAYRVRGASRTVLSDVSFEIASGGSFGLVGESGCGKSTIAMAVVRHLAAGGTRTAGSVRIDGADIYSLGPQALREVRARQVGVVYQDPVSALNPATRVGKQVVEVFEVLGYAPADAEDRALEALASVQIADPGRVMSRYPHQLSGGMAQRVVIAMAIAPQPSLLILDEPTAGLDATVAAEVLDLVADLRGNYGTSVMFISHNLGVIHRVCDHVGVLYAGRLVETGPTAQVFADPGHPYTTGLLRCIPRVGATKHDGPLETIPGTVPSDAIASVGCAFVDRCAMATEVCRSSVPPFVALDDGHRSRCHHAGSALDLVQAAPTPVGRQSGHRKAPLLRLDDVSKTFRQEGVPIAALRNISLTIHVGEALGLVGESGSGKTTLAHLIAGVHAPDSGAKLTFGDRPLGESTSARNRDQVLAIQMVFQNPDSSLNPRHPVRRILARAVQRLARVSRAVAQRRVNGLAQSVQLANRYLDARPGELSGGLKQRVAVARAFAGHPELVLCDEATSALDVSVQAAILNLLVDLQRDHDVSYLFISHDLGVVRHIADRIAVLYLGEIVEIGAAGQVFDGPHHPYTEALLSAVAHVDEPGRSRIRLIGEIPSASSVPAGCPFHTRCPRAVDICVSERPPSVEPHVDHHVACHLPVDALGRADGSIPLPTNVARRARA